MSKEKDTLIIWKERINKESKYGDKKKACDAAQTTAPTYLTAMKKERLEDLTDGELQTLSELIVILDKRKTKLMQIKEKYADK